MTGDKRGDVAPHKPESVAPERYESAGPAKSPAESPTKPPGKPPESLTESPVGPAQQSGAHETTQTSESHSGQGVPSEPRGRVLIVDDEPDVLESTALVVESLGYEAIRLAEPDRVLEVVAAEKPGVLLQDLRMPGLNVAGLVAALRSNLDTGNVHLVFFSAGSELADTARRLRAWGVLPKPFRIEQLAKLLEQAFGSPAADVEAGHDLQAEVRHAFHEYWDLISAVNNYVLVLERTPDLPPEARRSVEGLSELVLKLEARTERLRAGLRSVIGDGDRVRPKRRSPLAPPSPKSRSPHVTAGDLTAAYREVKESDRAKRS